MEYLVTHFAGFSDLYMEILIQLTMILTMVLFAYWLYPLEKKLFWPNKQKKQNSASMMVVPTYETQHNTVGLAFTAVL